MGQFYGSGMANFIKKKMKWFHKTLFSGSFEYDIVPGWNEISKLTLAARVDNKTVKIF